MDSKLKAIQTSVIIFSYPKDQDKHSEANYKYQSLKQSRVPR